jgi:dimethylargininase
VGSIPTFGTSGRPRTAAGAAPPPAYDPGVADAVSDPAYGGQTMVEPLRRVLVRQPPANTADWRRYGWRSQPDPTRLAAEHERFCLLLEQAGAEVVVGRPTTLDAIYVYDPALVADAGAVLLRPGKPQRSDEVEAAAADLERAGVPVVGRCEEPARVDGGDLAWLDERTLLAGRGYRTNEDGVASLERILGASALVLDLPHLHGPGEVLHLLSLFSPVDRDLVVAYLPLMPVRLVQFLAERGIRIVEVPGPEFETMGPNVLALAPRRVLMPERNVQTRRRLERAGVDVVTYDDDELSKGDGGPTCLTRPILRSRE